VRAGMLTFGLPARHGSWEYLKWEFSIKSGP
jgi:hypothetical protein